MPTLDEVSRSRRFLRVSAACRGRCVQQSKANPRDWREELARTHGTLVVALGHRALLALDVAVGRVTVGGGTSEPEVGALLARAVRPACGPFLRDERDRRVGQLAPSLVKGAHGTAVRGVGINRFFADGLDFCTDYRCLDR